MSLSYLGLEANPTIRTEIVPRFGTRLLGYLLYSKLDFARFLLEDI